MICVTSLSALSKFFTLPKYEKENEIKMVPRK